jgi:hypothetical protein
MGAMSCANVSNCCGVQRAFSTLLSSVAIFTVPYAVRYPENTQLSGVERSALINESCLPHW